MMSGGGSQPTKGVIHHKLISIVLFARINNLKLKMPLGWYTLMPAAVIDGFVDGAIWPGSGMYITWLGTKAFRRFKNRHPDKEITKESFLSRYFGYFYTFMFCGDVSANSCTSE